MKHTAVKALAVGLVASVLLSLGHFSALCGEIRGEVVRLHVLAHSDSEEDQALKLKVRDAVLMAAEGLLDGVVDQETALAVATEQLPTLQAAAQRCVEENGYAYPVAVELCEMYFTTRTYDTGTLPAGWYNALRVTIGSGEGRNWWCVVFPPICLGGATSMSDVVGEEAGEVVENAPRYQVRFKLVEWLEELFG